MSGPPFDECDAQIPLLVSGAHAPSPNSWRRSTDHQRRIMMLRHFVLFLLAVLMAVAVRAQEGMRVVTLLSEDRGFVDSTPIATKDIVSHLASQYAGQTRLPMVRIES